MSDKRSVTVTILSQSYTLVSDENEAHLNQVVHMIDSSMRCIAESIPHLDRCDVAILASLQLISDLLITHKKLDVLSDEINNLNEVITTALTPSP